MDFLLLLTSESMCGRTIRFVAVWLMEKKHFHDTPELSKGFIKDILSSWKMYTWRAIEGDENLTG